MTDDLTGVYIDADNEPFAIMKDGESWRMYMNNGRSIVLDDDMLQQLLQHSRKTDRNAREWVMNQR